MKQTKQNVTHTERQNIHNVKYKKKNKQQGAK